MNNDKKNVDDVTFFYFLKMPGLFKLLSEFRCVIFFHQIFIYVVKIIDFKLGSFIPMNLSFPHGYEINQTKL